MKSKPILDACCGSRMFWFDKNNPMVDFMDIRNETCVLSDGQLCIVDPNIIGDFTNMPFPDKTYKLVVWDPPHLVWLGNTANLYKMFGKLEDWRSELKKGFEECMRVLENIHIAWDLPKIDLTKKLKMMVSLIKPYKITCYVLVGFNSTPDQDLWRLQTLKELGILPFVQPYRDFENKRIPTNYEKDLARWANRAWLFKSIDFKDFKPRKGFVCKDYFQ